MSVKVIDKETFAPPVRTKFSVLADDINEIVDKRIEYSELELPYAPSTVAKDIQLRARKALEEKFCALTGITYRNTSIMPIYIVKRKDENKKYHILCHFDLEKWDKMIEEAKDKR